MESSWTDKHTWGLLSALLGLSSFVPYAVALRRGAAKPHCFSWVVWSLISGIAFMAQVHEGGGPGAWYLGVSAGAYLAVALFALSRGEKDLQPADWLALGASLAAIPLWYLTDDAALAVLLVAAIDVAAFVPTVRKSIARPYDEPVSSYALAALGLTASMAGLTTWSFTTVLPPATLALTDGAFVLLLLARRRTLARAASQRDPSEAHARPRQVPLSGRSP